MASRIEVRRPLMQVKMNKVIVAGAVVVGAILSLAFAAVRIAPTVPVVASGAPVAPGPDDAVQQALQSGKPAVVEFGANACASCREMKPVLAALARDYREQIAVVDLDIIKEPRYISRYRIQLMPTQVFYGADGKELGRHMGKISGDEILARLGVPSGRAP